MAEFPLLHLGASAFEAMFATHLSDLCGFFKLRGLSEEMLATGILAGEWLSWEAPGGVSCGREPTRAVPSEGRRGTARAPAAPSPRALSKVGAQASHSDEH